MCFEICDATLTDIRKGRFPLNHDCILQASFKDGCGLRYQFFTCRSQDSGVLISVLSLVFCIQKVVAIPVEQFNR